MHFRAGIHELSDTQKVTAPWLTDVMIEAHKRALSEFCTDSNWLSDIGEETLKRFRARRIASFVMSSNVLERTSCSGTDSHFAELVTFVRQPGTERALPGELASTVWDWEGEGTVRDSPQARAQALSHVAATCKMFTDAGPCAVSSLSVELLCDVHGTMFHGSSPSGDESVAVGEWTPGELRCEPLSAGTMEFVSVCSQEEMRENLGTFVQRLKSLLTDPSRKHENIHKYFIAVWALNAFLMLHPFRNGNGRMARLIFAWACAHLYGLDFPVVFSSGGSKPRKKYHQALRKLQQQGSGVWMMATALQSLGVAVRQLKSFCGVEPVSDPELHVEWE